MKDLIGLIVAYKAEISFTIKALILYWIFSALVGAIPLPPDDAPHWKRVGVAFLNTLAGNLTRGIVGMRDSCISFVRAIRGGNHAD
jgi:hypothetical protein